jgi:hypothetical protein
VGFAFVKTLVDACRCAGCAVVMLQGTTLLRNAAAFGAGAALAGDPTARASIVESSFIENEATGDAGEGDGLENILDAAHGTPGRHTPLTQ